MIDTQDRFNLKTSPVTMAELSKKAYDIQSRCEDHKLRNLRNSHFEGTLFTYLDETDDFRQVSLSDTALNQMSNKIGISAQYMSKCRSTGKVKLFEDNMNEWIRDIERTTPIMVREYENRARGILTPRYSVFDAPDVIDNLLYMADENDYQIKGYALDEERFHVRIIQPEKMDIDGEDLFPGMMINSSDIGLSALSIKFFIYKQVCTNGLVIAKDGMELFNHRHIGISSEEFNSSVIEAYSKFTTVSNNMKDYIKSAKGIILTDAEIDRFMEKIKRNIPLADTDKDKIINLMDQKYAKTKWGLINGLTEIAQKYDLDNRIRFEEFAGKLLVA